MRGRFGCTRILFENKVSLQLTCRIQSHVHRNVIESHLFYRFLSSHPKISKVSNRVWLRFAGKRLTKKMPKLLVVVQKNNLIQYKRLIPTKKKKTYAKVLDPLKDPRKNIFDSRKNYDPSKKYFDPRNPLNPLENLTHAIHAPT